MGFIKGNKWKILIALLLIIGIAGYGGVKFFESRVRNFLEGSSETLGVRAYLYGYPLVLMDATMRSMTNVSAPDSDRGAPVNQFVHVERFPDHTFRNVVRPNNDTLYSSAWLDLSKEPIVLSIPPIEKERYYLMEILDAWTNVFAAHSSRTPGNAGGNFAIVGPNWKGELPKDMTVLKSPTDMAWIIGRTSTKGVEDYPAVHSIQRQYKITPLSSWGKNYVPPENVPVVSNDINNNPMKYVDSLDPITYFNSLAKLMKLYPPATSDKPLLNEMAAVGLRPGEDFNMDALSSDMKKDFANAAVDARQAINELLGKGKTENGWKVIRQYLGRYGTAYRLRATFARIGLGVNWPEDAIYPNTNVDGDGQRLDGNNRYVLHFDKGQTPPVNAFWSLTMYDENGFLVDNPIKRFAIGDRDSLRFNPDGSLDIYIQNAAPAGMESNWLPAPLGKFVVSMRAYWPKKSLLDGTWKIPAISRIR